MEQNRGAVQAHAVPHEAALVGILALPIDAREARNGTIRDPQKIEVLLSRAGLSNDHIGAITGKSPGAVRKVVGRATPRKQAA